MDPPPEGSAWPGSIWHLRKRKKLPQPTAARDHCTPAHRTSYQVGRVRLSPPASPQPSASNGYCLIPDPAQHEKIRRRMPPWSPRVCRTRHPPRVLHYENIDILQHSSGKSRKESRIPSHARSGVKRLTAGWHYCVETKSLDPIPVLGPFPGLLHS